MRSDRESAATMDKYVCIMTQRQRKQVKGGFMTIKIKVAVWPVTVVLEYFEYTQARFGGALPFNFQSWGALAPLAPPLLLPVNVDNVCMVCVCVCEHVCTHVCAHVQACTYMCVCLSSMHVMC